MGSGVRALMFGEKFVRLRKPTSTIFLKINFRINLILF